MDKKMKKNINLCNGNPNGWVSADELTDAEVKECLDRIGLINETAGTPYVEPEESDKINEAISAAEVCEDDRDYVRKWVAEYGELVIG